jgi:hypothetical protein
VLQPDSLSAAAISFKEKLLFDLEEAMWAGSPYITHKTEIKSKTK